MYKISSTRLILKFFFKYLKFLNHYDFILVVSSFPLFSSQYDQNDYYFGYSGTLTLL